MKSCLVSLELPMEFAYAGFVSYQQLPTNGVYRCGIRIEKVLEWILAKRWCATAGHHWRTFFHRSSSSGRCLRGTLGLFPPGLFLLLIFFVPSKLHWLSCYLHLL